MSTIELQPQRVDVEPVGSAISAGASSETAPVETNAADARLSHRIAAWVALVGSVFSLAAVGPMFKYMSVVWRVPTALSVSWRGQVMLLFFAIPTWIEFRRSTPAERASWWKHLPATKMSPTGDAAVTLAACRPTAATRPMHIAVGMVVLVVSWAFNIIVWVKALNYTTVTRASLFSCAFPLLVMAYARFRLGVRHSAGEFVGVVLALVGIALALLDQAAASDAPTSALALVGDMLGLLSAVLLAIWIVFGESVRQILPLFIYTFVANFLHCSLLSIWSVLFEDTRIVSSFAADGPNHHLFGWLHGDFFLVMTAFGLIAGSVGFLAFNWCMKYIDPVVFSTVQLLDPVFTAWMTWAVGLEGVSM